MKFRLSNLPRLDLNIMLNLVWNFLEYQDAGWFNAKSRR